MKSIFFHVLFFSLLCTCLPSAVFSAPATMSGHNNTGSIQGVTITRHRPVKLNSEFAASSFAPSDEFVSAVSSFSGKNDRFSIAKDSSFSNKPTAKPKAKDNEFSRTSFSINDDAEFSAEPTPMPKRSR